MDRVRPWSSPQSLFHRTQKSRDKRFIIVIKLAKFLRDLSKHIAVGPVDVSSFEGQTSPPPEEKKINPIFARSVIWIIYDVFLGGVYARWVGAVFR